MRAQKIAKNILGLNEQKNFRKKFFTIFFNDFFLKKRVFEQKKLEKRDHDQVALATGLSEGSKNQKKCTLLNTNKKNKKMIFSPGTGLYKW